MPGNVLFYGHKTKQNKQKEQGRVFFPALSAEMVVSGPQVIAATSIAWIATVTLCLIHLPLTRETLH